MKTFRKGIAAWGLVALTAAVPVSAQTKNRTWFESSETCRKCHAKHDEEWRGSMMHYSAQSPVYQSFELTVRKLTGRFGAHDEANPTFCNNCHSPIASYQNDLIGLMKDEASIERLSGLGKEGISCTMCHSMKEPHYRKIPEKGLLGDSLANADVRFFPSGGWVGPTTEDPKPEPNDYHYDGFYKSAKSSAFLKSSEFCGACHNVHLPESPDLRTGQPYQVEQNTYGEWKRSAYSTPQNPFGKMVSCQDCHMSPYGSVNPQTHAVFGPGEYPLTTVALGSKRVRRHASHRFTAASIPLIDDKSVFPNRDNAEMDEYGIPKGQAQLRAQMLRIACSVDILPPDPKKLESSASIPVTVSVLNKGAGHRVPTGLAQEREVWLELVARDDEGNIWYRSGELRDGDLQDTAVELSKATLDVKKVRLLPDFNLRPFAALGAPTFNNAFVKKAGEGNWERVYFFSLADHVDNTRSLPPLVPVEVPYDLPVHLLTQARPGYCGKIKLEAKLRYRSFAPKLLQVLSQREPQLLKPEHLAANEVTTMAEASSEWAFCPKSSDTTPEQGADSGSQTYAFSKGAKRWLAFFQPTYWDKAKENCQARSCELASVKQYESLGLTGYTTQPGDNVDELWKERWTRDQPSSSEASTFALAGEKPVGVRPVGAASLERLPYFCVCGEER